MSVTRYMAVVDFGSTIMKYWQRMRLRTKYCSNCGAINDRDAIYCKKCGKAFDAQQLEQVKNEDLGLGVKFYPLMISARF
jgi:ribosomal protein L40E